MMILGSTTIEKRPPHDIIAVDAEAYGPDRGVNPRRASGGIPWPNPFLFESWPLNCGTSPTWVSTARWTTLRCDYPTNFRIGNALPLLSKSETRKSTGAFFLLIAVAFTRAIFFPTSYQTASLILRSVDWNESFLKWMSRSSRESAYGSGSRQTWERPSR